MILLLKIMALTTRANCASLQQTPTKLSDSTDINIYYDRAAPQDTMTLEYYNNIFNYLPRPGIDHAIRLQALMRRDGSYHFSFLQKATIGYIIVSNFGTYTFSKHKGGLLDQMIEKGDRITIRISDFGHPDDTFAVPGRMKYVYTGDSCRKYKALLSADSVIKYAKVKTDPYFDKDMHFGYNNPIDLHIREKLAFFRSVKTSFDEEFYNHLLVNTAYKIKFAKYIIIAGIYKRLVANADSSAIEKFRKSYRQMSDSDKACFSQSLLFESPYYVNSEIDRLETNDLIAHGSINSDRVVHSIIDNYSGIHRDKLLVAYIQERDSTLVHYNQVLDDALNIVKESSCRNILLELNNRRSGTLAYNFSLPGMNGKAVSLSDFKGKIVFIDFWYTGCENCTDYYTHELSKVEQYYRNNKNAVFITICIDKSVAQWKRSVLSGIYTSKDAINLHTTVNAELIRKYMVESYPHPVLIGRSGQIISFGDQNMRNKQLLIRMIGDALSRNN